MQSYWIWNYGDYELYHANLVNSRRQEYGVDYPAFWKYYDVDRNVQFFCESYVEKDGYVQLHLHGKGYLMIDNQRIGTGREAKITKGQHLFKICVCNLTGLPSAYIESNVCSTDKSWYTINENNEKIPVGCEDLYTDISSNPEQYIFSYQAVHPAKIWNYNNGILLDFDKEIFGFLDIRNVSEEDQIHVSYGESFEEATDTEYSVLFEDLSGQKQYRLRQRAFRYIFITGTHNPSVFAELEYLPLEYKGKFQCNDKAINKIWDVCAYTLHLNMREVLTEAVKRDRWLWAGDSFQAFKFNQYLFHDQDIVRRSLIGLRGKEPFNQHINTITDFSFYWVLALYEYYTVYHDKEFLHFIYPRAKSLMSFCHSRTNELGFIVGKYSDWIFIDWADIDKTGAVCAEQILYIAANHAMAKISSLLGQASDIFTATAENMTKKLNHYFWNDEKGAFIDSYESGKNHVTRHGNLLAILFDVATESQKQSIVNNVVLNAAIPPLTTPFFKGFELDVMGKIGRLDYVEDALKTYWQPMIDLGATTIWEEYDSSLSGSEHYSMYGDKYAKSLCHAWGASPIYLLGKYFAGVSVQENGYHVRPYLGKLEQFDCTVPLSDGFIRVCVNKMQISVFATVRGGTLFIHHSQFEIPCGSELVINNDSSF